MKINPILLYAMIGIIAVTLMVTLITLGVPSYIASTIIMFLSVFGGIAIGKQNNKK